MSFMDIYDWLAFVAFLVAVGLLMWWEHRVERAKLREYDERFDR